MNHRDMGYRQIFVLNYHLYKLQEMFTTCLKITSNELMTVRLLCFNWNQVGFKKFYPSFSSEPLQFTERSDDIYLYIKHIIISCILWNIEVFINNMTQF